MGGGVGKPQVEQTILPSPTVRNGSAHAQSFGLLLTSAF